MHENVLDSDESSWVKGAAEKIQALARSVPGREGWNAVVRREGEGGKASFGFALAACLTDLHNVLT